MDKNKVYTCTCSGSCSTESKDDNTQNWKIYIPVSISLVMLLGGIVMDNSLRQYFNSYYRLIWYILAYIPVAYSVFREAIETIRQKEIFTEFTLMIVATLGAFFIGEYPEGVAVMLFYSVGELLQNSAVNKAKRNIKSLLDVRPDRACVERNGKHVDIFPGEVRIGEIIQVKAGEKVSLDGVMVSESGSFNTSALTGESKPKTIRKGENVLAGMLNIDKVIEIKVTKKYEDSSLSRILELVQEATSRKAKTELLIRRFAKVYTPIIFLLAVLVTVIPYFFVADYVFQDWLYRALVFLVISCPCALVISIPLGYFGGIGAASRAGILFKGANYLDLLAKINIVVMDKTGTLTQGVFHVRDIVPSEAFCEKELLDPVVALEKMSNHPIARAIVAFAGDINSNYSVTAIEEISGQGLKGLVNENEVLAGNSKLMQSNLINYDKTVDSIPETTVLIAINRIYAGYITIADEVKEDAAEAIKNMHAKGIDKIVMLSGDKSSITEKVASFLGIDNAYGDLLPKGKVKHLEQLKADKNNVIAFVGDGINDAPSLAISDVGIAMGGMGSDAAIEVADVVIQTDQPSKIGTAIQIAKSTKEIVYQNITLAFTIKLIVLVLGGFGVANMWEAVFADVGVSLLAILNAVRILKMKF
ncbi:MULTISPECIES: heavy metal translocating P-type ATPase [Dysgonomonas]|uniref:P-type Zn(2+) transporter n=1 Tax=Dysgonomonas gadei ATCC BAA-286 TaxID=742766 RepID=F5IXB7_9BACT|nr:cadmium-translocating P-type ATPase [Dysgonomonas gadei ATCC BAA-286]MBF0651884.1 cadmium-translocating P-type ATPase [Dysgonomonas sp. GY75]